MSTFHFLKQSFRSEHTRQSLKTCLLLFFFFPYDNFAQSYLWPTNASEYMSSSFCEFREDHYHSAIDIKTWNTEGYPCYAVENGYIKRIRVSPFGYGKVIYVQLSDGNTAIYAHLQKFSDQVDLQVRARQFENKKYKVDWWPTNLKVKKGDIIAYTGRTGIGVPHLHFEIRNKQGNPVNPLQFYTQIQDHIRPRLQELAVIPLSTEAKINNSYLSQRFPLTHIKDGVYVSKKPIYAEGRIGLAVRGYDQADDVNNKYGYYKSTLQTAGQKIFELVYDELEFKTTAHINTEIYYPWWKELRDRFNKLFLDSFNPLPFYDRSLKSNGSLEVRDQPVRFKITVSDFYDNKSIISGEILAAGAASVDITYAGKRGEWAYVDFGAPPITDLSFSTQDRYGQWKAAKYFEILEGQIYNPEQILKARVALNDSTDQKLKININDKIEQVVPLITPAIPENISYKVQPMGKNLIIKIPEIDFRPFIRLEPQNIPLDYSQLPAGGIEILIPAGTISGRVSVLTMSADEGEISLPPLDYQRLLPDKHHIVSWFDSALVISAFEKSVTDTVLITAHRLETDTVLNLYPLASKIYEVGPNNFPIFRSLMISIKADSLPAWGKWSVYMTNGQDRLTFLPSSTDALHSTLTTGTSSLGKFVVASDTIAPVIFIKSPQAGKIYRKTPDIRLDIQDEISGIGDEENISLSMNGEYVLPEWDPEEDILMGLLKENLTQGIYLFEVRVRDRAGNMASKSVRFEIK